MRFFKNCQNVSKTRWYAKRTNVCWAHLPVLSARPARSARVVTSRLPRKAAPSALPALRAQICHVDFCFIYSIALRALLCVICDFCLLLYFSKRVPRVRFLLGMLSHARDTSACARRSGVFKSSVVFSINRPDFRTDKKNGFSH